MTTSFSAVADEYLSCCPADHRPVRRRVMRCVIQEIPGYQRDLEDMTSDQAKERWVERATERAKQTYGFIGVITVGLIVGAIVVACIEFVVNRILTHWFPEQINALVLSAESWSDDE